MYPMPMAMCPVAWRRCDPLRLVWLVWKRWSRHDVKGWAKRLVVGRWWQCRVGRRDAVAVKVSGRSEVSEANAF